MDFVEALKIIKIKCHPNSNPSPLVDEALETIEKALQRLESIDNADPSEALSMLLEIKQQRLNFYGKLLYNDKIFFETLEPVLLKAQEKENTKTSDALEALNTIRENLSNKTFRFNLVELLDIIEKELKRLADIDNANPSEALECLEKLGTHRIEYVEGFELGFTKTMPFKSTMEYKNIKQALIKAQEQEKVLEIIFEKEVNMQVFNQCEDVETYNKVYLKQKDRQLTLDEFVKIKEWLYG